jgi:RND family efflux transporter MFP subunit
MRKLLAFILIFSFAACSQAPEDEDAIRQQIGEYKKQVNELNNKILNLEKKLEEYDGDERFSVPVRVKLIDYEVFNHYFEVRGTAEAVNESMISPETSGLIEKIYVKEGETVKKNQLLVKLSTEIIENSIKEVESQLEYAETVYQKQKRLWDRKIGSEMQYLDAKNARDGLQKNLETLQAQLDMAYIRSSINGVVDEIDMKIGELAMPGVPLMQVVNLEKLYINADVSETYLASVKEGDMVELNFPVYPEIKMEVPVFRIGNVINPANRTFKMQLRINNPDNKLKPNILAVIRINDFSTPSALVVPSNIIKQDINGQYIYVIRDEEGQQVSSKIYIETGMSYNDQTMVIEGLQLGDKVITMGYNQVSDGAPVAVKG